MCHLSSYQTDDRMLCIRARKEIDYRFLTGYNMPITSYGVVSQPLSVFCIDSATFQILIPKMLLICRNQQFLQIILI